MKQRVLPDLGAIPAGPLNKELNTMKNRVKRDKYDEFFLGLTDVELFANRERNIFKQQELRLNTPKTVKALLNRPLFNLLESWLLIGRAKQFSNMLRKHGKEVYTLEQRGTIIGPANKRYPRSRHSRLKPISAVLVDCQRFTQEETSISVLIDEKIYCILDNLYKMGKIDNGKNPTYIAGVCASARSSLFPGGPQLVVDELLSSSGEIRRCKQAEGKTLNQRHE